MDGSYCLPTSREARPVPGNDATGYRPNDAAGGVSRAPDSWGFGVLSIINLFNRSNLVFRQLEILIVG